MEKKEYTLQLLESRLYDCEKFLRDLGREDEDIRERLKELKLNPDVERKKITNVVLLNNQLTEQIKELIEENDKIKTENNALKIENKKLQSLLADRDTHFTPSADTGYTTHRRIERKSDILDMSEFDLDKSSYDTNEIIDINKLLSLKHDYPDIFMEKMLKNWSILDKKLHAANKEAKVHKKQSKFVQQKYKILEQEMQVLRNNYAKSETKRKKLEEALTKNVKDGTGATNYNPRVIQNVNYDMSGEISTYKPPISEAPYAETKSIKKRPQNVFDAISNIKRMGAGSMMDSVNFNFPPDVSSILVSAKVHDGSSDEDNSNILKDVEENN